MDVVYVELPYNKELDAINTDYNDVPPSKPVLRRQEAQIKK